MYGIIRSYKYDKADGPEVTRVAREIFAPIVEAEEGFIEFHWICLLYTSPSPRDS